MADNNVTAQGYYYPRKVRNPFWGGDGGTTDYEELDNKPKINGVTLTGNKTSEDLHIDACDCDELTTGQVNALIALL